MAGWTGNRATNNLNGRRYSTCQGELEGTPEDPERITDLWTGQPADRSTTTLPYCWDGCLMVGWRNVG
eukprot:8793050-Alexandrium_andersonii.AAC.1